MKVLSEIRMEPRGNDSISIISAKSKRNSFILGGSVIKKFEMRAKVI